MIKIQIKSVFENLLFEHESKKNTILETLLRAVSEEVDLRGANLRGAVLRGVDLRGVDLRGSNLRGSNLRGAILEGTILIRAILEGVILEGAILEGADLRGADLRGAVLEEVDLRGAKNIEYAVLPQFCKWPHGIKGDLIKIGCKEKTINEWDLFFNSDLEFDTERGTPEFKQIQAIFESYKAYMNFLAI